MMAGQLSRWRCRRYRLHVAAVLAFGLIGIHEYLRRLSGDSLVNQTRETLTCRLMERFEASAHPDWRWFEEELSYDNASSRMR